MKRCGLKARLLAGSLTVALLARGAEPAIDADLLEFLGSVDGEDADWHDFLEHTDLNRVSKPVTKPPGKAAAEVPAQVRDKDATR